MSSYTETFSRTHAKYLASKVITDLYQCSRLYGSPSTARISDYENELIEMLAGGFVDEYEFGFKKDGKRVICWQYRVNALGQLVGGSDDHAGGVYGRADIAGASYYNFMTFSSAWSDLSDSARSQIEARLPFVRGDGSLPGDGAGYWVTDRTYSNGGVSVNRRTFRPL
jgi:Bacterial HORMA domain family 1